MGLLGLAASQQVMASSTVTFGDYDDASNPQTITDATGRIVSISYNEHNQPLRVTLCGTVCGDGNDLTTSSSYTDGQLTGVVLPDGMTTSYVRDTLGFVTQITTTGGGLSLSESLAPNAFGLDISMTDARGVTSTVNSFNKQLQVTSATANSNVTGKAVTSTMSYFPEGQLKAVRVNEGGAAGKTGTTSVKLGAMGTESGYLPEEVTQSWTNPDGSSESVRTSYVYDALGRLLSETAHTSNPDGGGPVSYTTSYAYADNVTVAGLADCASGGCARIITTGADGGQTIEVFDSLGRLVQQTMPRGEVSTWTYDSQGRLATQTTGTVALGSGNSILAGNSAALNLHTQYSYDAAGRLVRTLTGHDSNGDGLLNGAEIQLERSQGYDDFGRLQWQLDGDTATGVRQVFAYDNGGRPVDTWTLTGGSGSSIAGAEFHAQVTYDGLGRVLTQTKAPGTADAQQVTNT